ncbi:MAG: MFS transporter [Promethearchaeota archaeon]|nr:MAG: MFS transporter [Candidatus Lokiarchaeota archaeon]
MEQYEYKKYYSVIFILFYLIQGFVQGIPYLVFQPYLTKILGGYNLNIWMILWGISQIPWAIKMIVGIFNDRGGTKFYGRRFPWIISFGIFGAIWWFLLAVYLPKDQSIYLFLLIYIFFIMIGMAFADTALDGLILDVVPKNKLARIQGYTWAMMLVGMGAGGMLLGLIFLSLDAMPVLFILTGILMIFACFLPYFIKEPASKGQESDIKGRPLISMFTKLKNWKIILYTFLAGVQALLILEFFKYVVLIPMGVVNVDETLVSLAGGTSPEGYLNWNSAFYLLNGIGTFIFSMIAGKIADISRKKAVTIFYLVYIPFCLISIVPFIFFIGFLPALIMGFIFMFIFGGLQGALVVSNQTIRADLSKHEYPTLKSTFYAFLVSLSNLGQNVGSILGGIIITIAVIFTSNFGLIYFLVSAFCALCLLLSYILFRTIDVGDYELDHVLQGEEDILFA